MAEEHIELGPVTGPDTGDRDPSTSPPHASDASPPGGGTAQPRAGLLRPRTIVLGALGLLGTAAVITSCVFGAKVFSQKDATLTPPDAIGAFTHDTGGGARTADDLSTALGAGVGLTDTVGAVYTDPAATDRSILFAGGTGLSLSPSSKLDEALDLLSDSTGGVADRHEVPAGDLGGVMTCGTVAATADGPAMAVCGWADYGSVAIALFPQRPVAESADLLRRFRTAIQHRF